MQTIVKNIFILLLIFGLACSPPRARRYSSKNKLNSHIAKPKPTKKRFGTNSRKNYHKINSAEKYSLTKPRFSDTTYINLNSIEYTTKQKITNEKKEKKNSIEKAENNNQITNNEIPTEINRIKEYRQAIELFNNDNFQESCPIIEHIAQTLPDNDTLKYDAMFYWSECLIQKNKLKKSIQILSSLINNKNSTNSILEKSLVRLGHLYCLQNDKQTAKIYFNRLRIKFPHSAFLQLANCGVVNK